jgi:hypothetical protein
VANGIYRLRLAAFANNGGYIYKVVQIGVNNVVVPTQPPIVPPTGVLPTPIPFNTGQVAPSFPTAQATLPAVQVIGATSTTSGLIPFGQLMPLASATP